MSAGSLNDVVYRAPLEGLLYAFHATFQEVTVTARRLAMKAAGKHDPQLLELLRFALDSQTTSEYPFIFKYSFCRSEKDGAAIQKVAAGVHLFQSSAFITDDIFDGGTMRYGVQALHRKYGISYAIIAAELLQAVALETICLELERGEFSNKGLALAVFNEIVRNNYVGQYLDLRNGRDCKVTTGQYYRMIALTTGRFLGNLAKFGALLAGKSPSCIRYLTDFAFYYGMALQVTDDIIDLTETPGVTGKSFACDLKSRKMRLPMIEALRLGKRRDAKKLRDFMSSKRSGIKVGEIIKLIEKNHGLDASKDAAGCFIKKSLSSIDAVNNPFSRKFLRWLPEHLLTTQNLVDGQSGVNA